MTVYTEKLPPSKTEPNRGFKLFRWSPEATAESHTVGTILFETPKTSCEFLVSEFPTSWGRGFHLEKMCGAVGDDKEATSYDVLVCGKGNHQCDCKGFAFGKGKPCRHILALVDCVNYGWL